MPASDSADKADFHEPKSSGTGRRPRRDRDKRAGPRYVLGPPRTVPMTAEERSRAVRAWAVLIAAWWTDNPPEEETE